MGPARARNLTLDSGALVALERRSGRIRRLLALAGQRSVRTYVPAGVLAQVWRGGARQQPLAALLSEPFVEVVPLDEAAAKAAGELCGRQGTDDIVDASVALCARITWSTVITGDPDDLRRLDPRLSVEVV